MLKQSKPLIYEEIKRRIIELEMKPGDPINEKELSAEFGVSRTPIREALIKLTQIDLVEFRPRVGTFVTQIDIATVKSAYEVKKNLEAFAAELAAKRATDEEIKILFQIIERFSTYDLIKDYKLCIQDDQLFHEVIRTASKNDILIDTLDMLNTKTARFLQSIHYVIQQYDGLITSLNSIADAIRNRDAEEARIQTESHTRLFLEEMSKNFFA
ncbi:GntR family transcriptional regulator [Fusibacter bizertensis]|uniref:GntR family transcriptional regulator n=1 Tax=Fusibacter bizertensis TaxID=1488331 RepID=A0ABT6NA34_9FIRM|nr:GntR family transcriptional regulator [Fusibacter bizertensis]MDH8677269.1 GntR family transcriptional regulator [Fusibacter bizertensis]